MVSSSSFSLVNHSQDLELTIVKMRRMSAGGVRIDAIWSAVQLVEWLGPRDAIVDVTIFGLFARV